MKAVFLLASVFSVLALLLITLFLFVRGMPALANVGFFKFVFGTKWSTADPKNQSFGVLPMIVGTLYVTALATLIGVTVGLFTAIFLYKFCPKKLAAVIRQLINLLAGIPSVVFGLFGLVVIVPAFQSVSPTAIGEGPLAASLILSIMILPTIVSITLDALHAVPKANFEGALALGASKERATFSVMLPAAKSGVFAAVVLAIGRVIGETMAVIMVIGGSTDMPNGSLFQSISTLTSSIATGAMDATGGVLDAKIATGVVLFVFTLIINVSFSLLKNRNKDKKRKKSKKSGLASAVSTDGEFKARLFGLKSAIADLSETAQCADTDVIAAADGAEPSRRVGTDAGGAGLLSAPPEEE
jgi:phosphate transport system permease protein